MDQNTKKSKSKVLSAIVIFLLLGVVDVGILLTAINSEVGFFTELGTKKTIVIVLEHVVIFALVFGQNKWKKLWHKNFVIKLVNIVTALLTPVGVFILVQLIISENSFLVQSDYYVKNLVLYYLLYMLMLLICRKVSVTISLYTIVLVFVAVADYFVTLFRGNALMLMDVFNIGTAANVAENYTLKLPVKMGICLLGVVIFLAYQVVFQCLEVGKRNAKGYMIRLSIFAIVFVGIWRGWSALASEGVGQWETVEDYKSKGFIYELACESQYLEIEKPEGYSTERVQEIVASVEEKSSQLNSEKDKIVPKNLIVIMNESLADFEEFENFQASDEILAGIHSLSENTKKGYLYVPAFGGGTADTEYEVLTGNTKEFFPNGAVAYQLYCESQVYGMANTLEEEGYSTTAIHPLLASGWNRQKVYSYMNFENFISLENWGDDPKYYRYYVRDSSAFKMIKKLCKNKDNDNQFMFCVTIQNHGGYSEETSNNFEADISLSYDEDYPEAEMYLSLAKKSDETFMKLLDYFKEVDEPTMIVMFGDHWPKLEDGFYSDVMGKDYNALDLEGVQQTRRTPYVIWTNYPSESGEEDMSTNYFGSYILEQAGLEMTTYNKFLLQLKEKLPVVGTGAVCDTEGNWYVLNDLPDEYKDLVNDYKILQYNNVVDRKHRVDDIFELAG